MPLGAIGCHWPALSAIWHHWVPLASTECRWVPSPSPCCSQDAEGFPIDIKVKDNGDGTFHCVYVPTKAMKHTVIVAWGGVNTPNSPFRVGVIGGPWGAVGVPGGVGGGASHGGC